jgi:predicted ATPase
MWILGYAEAARADAGQAVSDAREIGHAVTLMFALFLATITHILLGEYGKANALGGELTALGEERGASLWKTGGMVMRAWSCAMTDSPSEAADTLTVRLTAFRSTGSTFYLPILLSVLARTYAALRQFDEGWRCIGEAMTMVEATKEAWFEAEINRLAGEIALVSPEREAAKAQAYFERALSVARGQQAKSWELRAAMSMARLWRDQGKHEAARELLAPVYGWFKEGFDTHDLKEAKALLDELAA